MTMRIWLYTDQYATLGRTQDDEYKEIRLRLEELLEGVSYSEYVTIEFDTVAGTAIVVPRGG
jgi:hypothetical protein